MAEHCPTCGSPVIVKSGDEGTSYYELGQERDTLLADRLHLTQDLDALRAIDAHRNSFDGRFTSDDLYELADKIRDERKGSDGG